jgi:hypothetical protein
MATDLTTARMTLGFQISAVVLLLWASLDYNRFIKFWMLRPAPYSKRVTVGFRLFFLACVVGGIWRVFDDIVQARQSPVFHLSTVAIALAWIVVFFLLVYVVEQLHKERFNKEQPGERPYSRELK